ncbi:MAG: 30S ribosomal protein S7 [Rickettsiales bacterium]|jgi:small subunit ribosomal protein S7|nr:30S ribosomal protein S7 [Rickettsiales bacterium]
MRRRKSPVREIIPDAKFGSIMVTRLINTIMLDGKKSIIEKAVYGAFEIIEEKMKKNPLEVFDEVIERITPTIEVRARRIGGATYQIPTEVKERRGSALALKWLVTSVRKQSGKSLAEKIFKACNEILNNTGWAVKKREEVFKMAEANKAFAHFAW